MSETEKQCKVCHGSVGSLEQDGIWPGDRCLICWEDYCAHKFHAATTKREPRTLDSIGDGLLVAAISLAALTWTIFLPTVGLLYLLGWLT